LLGIVGQKFDDLPYIPPTITTPFYRKIFESFADESISKTQFLQLWIYVRSTPIARDLVTNLLYSPSPNTPSSLPSSTEEITAATILSDFGAIQLLNGFEFYRFSCSGLRYLMLTWLSKRDLPRVTSEHLTDTKAFLTTVVQHFNPAALSARKVQNVSTGFTSEYCFQAEFYGIVRNIVPYGYIALPEVKCETKKRADIEIRNSHNVLYELKAGLDFDLKSVPGRKCWQNAIAQAGEYAFQLRCTKAVLINFTCFEPEPLGVTSYETQLIEARITIPVETWQVWFSKDFTQFKIV